MIHLHSAGNDASEARGLLEDVRRSVGEALSGNPRSGLSRANPPEEEEKAAAVEGWGKDVEEEEKKEEEEEGQPGTSYFFLLISLHLMHGLLNACLSGLAHD